MLPFEFTVKGPPLSHQTRDKRKLAAWRRKVRRIAKTLWAHPPLSIPLKVTVTYYHEGNAVWIDNDNMIKPILDALNKLVYVDDRIIVDIYVRKTSIDNEIYARWESLILLKAFSDGVEFLHVTIDSAPDHRSPLR
jgi:Holliday junction resolvase RusA-like endonuclease